MLRSQEQDGMGKSKLLQTVVTRATDRTFSCHIKGGPPLLISHGALKLV